MLSREKIRELFHLAELEDEEELRRKNLLRREELSAEQKAQRLEYIIEHLNLKPLIAVHQTDHFPENGRIRPIGHHLLTLDWLGITDTKKVIEDLQLKHPRITIHFTLNFPIRGVVAHGQQIEWHGKYAVLIPVEDIVNRIVSLNPVDTWIIGALDLPSSAEILIKEEEYFSQAEVWHANAGRAKIVPYPTEWDIHKAIEVRIKKRGYNLVVSAGDYWFQGTDIKNIMDFINNSPFLSNKEKDDLIRLCVRKGFTQWMQVFEILAEKFKKEAVSHKTTMWRAIEKFAEDVFKLIFKPSPHDESSQNTSIIVRLNGFKATSVRYKEEILKLLHSRKYTNPQEIEYLNELVNTLNKIEGWLDEIIRKIKSEKRENQTWGVFLREYGIV